MAPLKRNGGRNNTGRLTAKHHGGGHKRRYRIIDVKRQKDNIPATVKAIEYDPNRTAYIALLHYQDGAKSYIIAPETLKAGDEVRSGERVPPETGNVMPLKNIPMGTTIHCIELHPGKGGQLARGAGASAQLMGRSEDKYVIIKLPSGEERRINKECRATIGVVSNSSHANTRLGKAGCSRWAGRRPHVRGTVKNPNAHPMGGGEGKNSGGLPQSAKGLGAKGNKTRRVKKYSDRNILKKRKK